jgi:hypothetical protein
MTRTRLVILSTCGMFFVWTLLSIPLLLYGNDWWLSGLTTLTIFAWLGGLLVVIFQQGRVRAAATGAVIAAAAYWLLALGPWFSTNVGPTLLTSRMLAQADVMLHGNSQQTQMVTWSYPQTQPVYVTGDINTLQTSPLRQASLAILNSNIVMQGSSVFQPLGQWLLIWMCAAVGGCAALWMQMGSESKRPRPSPPETMTSPSGADS